MRGSPIGQFTQTAALEKSYQTLIIALVATVAAKFHALPEWKEKQQKVEN